MIQDVEEAFRDSIGPFLRVHVKLIVSTSPHMLAVGVGAVVGEPPLPLVTTALETSLPSDKDFFRRPETDFSGQPLSKLPPPGGLPPSAVELSL